MPGIELHSSSQLARGVSRQTGRQLTRLSGQTELVIARTDAVADVQSAKLEALSAVTQRGLQGAAFISQVEQQLAQAVPLAASRLQAVAEIGTLGLTQLVMDTANVLRRV